MKKNKYILAIVPVLFLLSSFVLTSCGRSSNRVVKVVKGPFLIKVHAVGRLKSSNSVFIGCPLVRRMWNYTISFMAPEGKQVKKGMPILAFDAKDLQEKLMVKSSELETSRKELEKIRIEEQEKTDGIVLNLAEAKVKTDKAERMAQKPQDLTARSELEKLRKDFELAKLSKKLVESNLEKQKMGQRTRIRLQESKVKKLENEVRELEAGIAKMKISAPKDGIVVYVSGRRGKKKAVGESTWMGEKILELPDLSLMEVAAWIPEPQAGKVKEGLPVEIRLDSNPDHAYKGKIERLGRIFREKSDEQPAMVFDAVIKILEPDPEVMRPGMAAGVDIIVASREDVLQVPEQAVMYGEDGLYAWKETFSGRDKVVVKTGAHSGGMVEILDGLGEGDRLLVPTGEEEKEQ